MVAEIDGVMKVVPVPISVPPVASAYQWSVPIVVLAESVTVPVPHLLPPVTVTFGPAVTVATTAVLVADLQVPFTAFTACA